MYIYHLPFICCLLFYVEVFFLLFPPRSQSHVIHPCPVVFLALDSWFYSVVFPSLPLGFTVFTVNCHSQSLLKSTDGFCTACNSAFLFCFSWSCFPSTFGEGIFLAPIFQYEQMHLVPALNSHLMAEWTDQYWTQRFFEKVVELGETTSANNGCFFLFVFVFYYYCTFKYLFVFE